MGSVVSFNRFKPVTTIDVSKTRERVRRSDVLDALDAMLKTTCRAEERLAIGIQTLHDGLAVVATIDGRVTQRLSPTYPETRIDDFAMVVRGGIGRWRSALTRRMAMHSVD